MSLITFVQEVYGMRLVHQRRLRDEAAQTMVLIFGEAERRHATAFYRGDCQNP
jgi:hypothetical protein